MKRRPLVASLVSSFAAILILAAGCGEQSPTATRLEPTGVAASREGVGRRVRILQARYHAGRFSQAIGPEGGVLRFRIGTLVIPRGALSERTRISAYVNGEDLAVQFEPHGLVFNPGHEPTLAIKYGAADPHEVQIRYFGDDGQVLETLSTYKNHTTNSARAKIYHFSAYGLAASL